MAKRSKRRQAGATRSDAEIEADLEALDAALVEGDDERAAAALQALHPVRRRLPDLLVRRLVAGRLQNAFFFLDLLAASADRRLVPLMERIADAAGVPDTLRLGAQRHIGWFLDEPDERRDFLDGLADAEAALVETVRHAVAPWPPDGGLLDEVHLFLHVLPPERARAVVARTAAELGADACWLLHGLLHEEDRALRRLALAEAVRLRTSGSEGAVARLARSAPDRGTRREAEDALRHLHAAPAGPARPLPALVDVKASPPDASGSQVVVVARRAHAGLVMCAAFLCEEEVGLSVGLAARHATADWLAAVEARFAGDAAPLVAIDLPTARPGRRRPRGHARPVARRLARV